MDWTNLATPHPPPLSRVADPRWHRRGVTLYVKRDDLLRPAPNDPFCGNKWRKLQGNLLRARALGAQTLLTFGGAFSNHLAAAASAGRHLGFETIGIVRGEPVDNPTLARARRDGMRLHFVDRAAYRRKATPAYLKELRARFGSFYALPEGGTNEYAYAGCAESAREIMAQCPDRPTHLALACGTGGTLVGMLGGLPADNPPAVLGVSVLKGSFLRAEVQRQLDGLDHPVGPWEMHDDYHHGGYARQSPALTAFGQDFHQRHGILLEPVYTGKLFFGLYGLLERGHFSSGSVVVGVHTGGLQSFACEIP